MSSRVRQRYIASRPAPPPPPRMGPRKWAYHPPVHSRSGISTFLRRLLYLAVAVLSLLVLAFFGYRFWVDSQSQAITYAYDSPQLPHHHVGIVFGAGLTSNGGPSPMLYDRVATAADLYKKQKVDKLLMTGDNSSVTHNEVEAMRETAVDLGVPDKDIVLDYAGFNTWDSCYRAREVFGLKDATLVTQRFHLPRALHTCTYLQVSSVGVAADRQPYNTFSNEMREMPALFGTAVRILLNDQPKFLGPRVNIDVPQDR